MAADRELPVVWAVAKGSLKNKAILVPSALAISVFVPWAITPLLMIGGAYLCFEGVEKLAHKWLHAAEDDAHRAELARAVAEPTVDLVALERDKIRGAIRTDFILSAEIIVIALGTVATAGFERQVAVLIGVALLMTVGVYGLVAGIVKLDDAGLALCAKSGNGAWARGQHRLGRFLLRAAPLLMKFLSIAGTAAMFLVGGGILVHGVAWLQHIGERVALLAGPLGVVAGMGWDAIVGIVAGAVVLAAVQLFRRVTSVRASSGGGQ